MCSFAGTERKKFYSNLISFSPQEQSLQWFFTCFSIFQTSSDFERQEYMQAMHFFQKFVFFSFFLMVYIKAVLPELLWEVFFERIKSTLSMTSRLLLRDIDYAGYSVSDYFSPHFELPYQYSEAEPRLH